jgi:hypothetical protein
MNTNPFFLDGSEYVRDIDVLKHYLRDQALYLSKMTGKDIETCTDFVKRAIQPGGKFAFKDPDVVFLERKENGDRVETTGKFSTYLRDVINDNEVIAPTFTTYLPVTKCKSILSGFIDTNVAKRGVAKKAGFAAKSAGNVLLEAIKNIEQTGGKLSNNALSGAHVSASTPLYNKSAHSSLTSNCRVTAGYGNANNEKILSGNRHYWSPDTIRGNIISIIGNTDYEIMLAVIEKYKLVYPSVDQAMACITYSSNMYGRNKKELNLIKVLLTNLTPLERAAFVYTGDLYQIMLLNDSVVRTMISRLIEVVDYHLADPGSEAKKLNEEFVHLAVQVCETIMKEQIVGDMKAINAKMAIGTPAYSTLISTAMNITNVLNEYGDFIKAFMVTVNVPSSVAHFPDSIRRAAVTGDTDSTIFTVQDWVVWHQGYLGFDDKCNAVAAVMIFLACQSVTHVLARMSANVGVEQKRIFQIAMKNEYKFDVFTPTQVAKHYFAMMGCQEGNLFAQYEKEIKGVHLKSSNAPKVIMDLAKKMMTFIMQSVVDGNDIEITKLLKEVGDIERDVIASIKRGSYEYFRKGQINTPDSYTKNKEESPYVQYTMWEEIFAPKYGSSQLPPYASVKVSTELNKPGAVREWLDGLEDKELVGRIEQWMLKTNRKHLGSNFMLPEAVINSVGIPDEILASVGVRKIVLNTTGVFYIILETLGIYLLNKKITRLISDTH